MTPADYPARRLLLDMGAQLFEVLPAGEHYETHLPVPSRRSTRIAESVSTPPVVSRSLSASHSHMSDSPSGLTQLPQSRTRDIFTRPAANTPPATGKEQARASSCVQDGPRRLASSYPPTGDTSGP